MQQQNDTITPLLDYGSCNPYQPKAALIVFQKANDSGSAFIELREIRRDGSMGSAKPVSCQFIQDLLSSFSEEYRSVPHGTIPENLIYCDTRKGRNVYLWYTPPGKRNRFFSEKLGLDNGVYHVPGTLYLAEDDRLSVWCFEGRKPALDKVLLGVPYFNVYSDGKVCMGSAHPDIPDTAALSYEDILSAWEKAFWNSIDVHTNGSPSTRENLVETIKAYKDKAFDTSALVTRNDGLTVNKIIKKISR